MLREEITFIPSRPREIKCVNITTYRDNRYEGTECRGIILETDTTVSLSPKEAVLHILDKNGEVMSANLGSSCSIHFNLFRGSRYALSAVLLAKNLYSTTSCISCCAIINLPFMFLSAYITTLNCSCLASYAHQSLYNTPSCAIIKICIQFSESELIMF